MENVTCYKLSDGRIYTNEEKCGVAFYQISDERNAELCYTLYATRWVEWKPCYMLSTITYPMGGKVFYVFCPTTTHTLKFKMPKHSMDTPIPVSCVIDTACFILQQLKKL